MTGRGGAIFILGLQRGGTNQLLNVLRSHPDATWPDGELHEVLRPVRAARAAPFGSARTLLGYLPIALRSGDVLSPHRPPGPRGPGPGAERWMARRLAAGTAANAAEVARFKAAMADHGLHRRPPECPARMVVKAVGYNVALAGNLAHGHPRAAFLAVMRDPVGVCESVVARGGGVDRAIALVRFFADEVVRLRERGLPVLLIRFEDLVADIAGTAHAAYRFCGLDPDATLGLCLQHKERLTDGSGRVTGIAKREAYYPFAEAGRHMRGDVNDAARGRLPPEPRRVIERECGDLLERLGYAGRPGAS